MRERTNERNGDREEEIGREIQRYRETERAKRKRGHERECETW